MRSALLFEPAVEAAETRRARFELASLLSLVLGVFFLGTGIAKVASVEFVVATFDGWPAPLWTLVALGAVELAAAICALIPTTRLLGAGTLTLLMTGAAAYHVARGELGLLPVPLTFLAVAVSVLRLELSLRRGLVPAPSR